MDIIYYCLGIAVALLAINYLWKRLPKDPEVQQDESAQAPYKVETPVSVVAVVEPVVTAVVEPVVAEVKTAAPELKIVTGSAPKAKKPAAKKPAAKAPVKKPVVKTPAKPRTKKPTDNA